MLMYAAAPAVNTPAGRAPGITTPPRFRSLAPMANTMAFGWISISPSYWLIACILRSAPMLSTMVLSIVSTSAFFASFMEYSAYSGPLISRESS